MKIGVMGDPHFRVELAYADYISDRREGERKAALDFIVETFKDCDAVVFMGDNFDKPNPPSHVIKSFTEFVERFNGKQIFILAGNHEKTADGKSAIDYLKEVKNPKWRIITDCFVNEDNLLGFVPYFYRQEIKVDSYELGTRWVMNGIKHLQDKGVKYLFVHHAISDTLTREGQSTNLFPEIVLPKAELSKMFNFVIGGHIHKPQLSENVLVTGSAETSEAGDVEKFVWTLDTEKNQVEQYRLPLRPIYRLENPDFDELKALNPHSIVKVILTNPELPVSQYKEILKRFDAYILLEQYPDERQKLDIKDGAMIEFTVENLLGLYADAKKIEKTKLLAAWELIK